MVLGISETSDKMFPGINDSGVPGIGKHRLSFVAYIGDNILEAARACNPL
jgi:hypothetical protein